MVTRDGYITADNIFALFIAVNNDGDREERFLSVVLLLKYVVGCAHRIFLMCLSVSTNKPARTEIRWETGLEFAKRDRFILGSCLGLSA